MPNRDIILSQKTRVRGISLIKDYKAFNISFREIVHNNLSLKEKYIAQQLKMFI